MNLPFKHMYDTEPKEFNKDYEYRVLVKCPKCGSCAHLILRYKSSTLSCKCGYVSKNTDRSKCKYWLSIPCCGHTLHASSEEHLLFLEKYVSSSLRERLRKNWPDRDLLFKMPKWFHLSKNRAHILKCMGKLKEKLKEA